MNSVNIPITPGGKIKGKKKGEKPGKRYATVAELLAKSPREVKDLYASLKDFILNLGDEVQEKELLYYFAYKRIKTFASVEIHPKTGEVVLYLRLASNIVTREIEDGFMRDVENIGHLGIGNISVHLSSENDFDRVKPFIVKSYEMN